MKALIAFYTEQVEAHRSLQDWTHPTGPALTLSGAAAPSTCSRTSQRTVSHRIPAPHPLPPPLTPPRSAPLPPMPPLPRPSPPTPAWHRGNGRGPFPRRSDSAEEELRLARATGIAPVEGVAHVLLLLLLLVVRLVATRRASPGSAAPACPRTGHRAGRRADHQVGHRDGHRASAAAAAAEESRVAHEEVSRARLQPQRRASSAAGEIRGRAQWLLRRAVASVQDRRRP
eukprot:scaffold144100_cov133-Phaeocystis_antarctica.AAC.3